MGRNQKEQSEAICTHAERREFFIKRPGKDRANYCIIARVRSTGKSETLKNSQVDSINAQFKRDKLDHEQVLEALRREIRRLRKEQDRINPKPAVKLWPANARILDDYWNTAYKHRRHQLRAKDAAFNRLRRAIESLGDTPLTASADEIQAAIDSHALTKGGNQRVNVSAIRQLLKFIGRHDVYLNRWKKPPKKKIRHLTLAEFESVAPLLPEFTRILAWVAFATGCRVGEVFGLDETQWDKAEGSIFVAGQQLRTRNPGPVKNDRDRFTLIMDEGEPWLKKWFKIPKPDRDRRRNDRHAKIIGDACEMLFPNDPVRVLTFHDLRHCYSIHMCKIGLHPKIVAACIGDSVATFEEFYRGHVLTTDDVRAARALLKSNQTAQK